MAGESQPRILASAGLATVMSPSAESWKIPSVAFSKIERYFSSAAVSSPLRSSSSRELSSIERSSMARSSSAWRYAASTAASSCVISGAWPSSRPRVFWTWRDSRRCTQTSVNVVMVIVWLWSAQRASATRGEISP